MATLPTTTLPTGKNFFKTTLGVLVTLGFLGLTAYVVSYSWKKGQKKGFVGGAGMGVGQREQV